MKTKKIKYLLLVVCCLISSAAMAQTRISGTVNAPDGPVMMCNVVEIDANNRNVSYSQTDINGNFSMEIVNTKNKLRVSYIGYKTVTVPIGDKTVFNIEMQDENTLTEVVVKAKAKFRSGGLVIPENEVSVAAQTFNMSEVEGLSFTSADEALQGKIAGLDIIANSGNLGAGTSMRLRGVLHVSQRRDLRITAVYQPVGHRRHSSIERCCCYSYLGFPRCQWCYPDSHKTWCKRSCTR